MAHESIYELRRKGFPKETKDESSYRTTIEYIGLLVDLEAAGVNTNIVWGEYPGLVTSGTIDPIEGTEHGILTVIVERKYGSDSGEGGSEGTLEEETHEIDWVDVQRSLYEHPEFRVGGGGTYALTNEDVAAIKKWEQMPDPNYKKDYIYVDGKLSAWGGGSEGTSTLSTNAQKLAKGIEQGIDYWVDKAPVARKNSTYAGGPGPVGSAGQKEDPTGFPNLPTGYEWVKESDRSLKTGGQTRWKRNEEWVGAKKVLIDKDEIFWT